MVTVVGTDAVSVARAQIGKPYRWAASGPSAFDCSGLVLYSFKQAYGKTLPHSSALLSLMGTKITKAELQPNDLVFHPGHVQIYSGNGMVIEAPTTGIPVREVPMWGDKTYRRLAPGGSMATPVQGFNIPGAAAGPLGDVLGLDKYVSQFMSSARHWAIRLFEVLLGGALIIAGLDKIGAGAPVAKAAKFVK